MPVITWEEYEKRLLDGQGFTEEEALEISSFMEGVLGNLLEKQKETQTIGSWFKKLANAISNLLRPFAAQPEEQTRKRKEALQFLDGLKDLLERTEPGNEKNNYEMIKDSLNEEKFGKFQKYLSILNEKCGTGIAQEMIEPQLRMEERPSFRINKASQDLNMSKVAASQYIETIRDLKYEKNNQGEYNSFEVQERFLKIMAARFLADSVRGERDKLDGKLLTEEMVNKKAAELKATSLMTRFLENLRENPQLMDRAVAAAKKGHGGGLDDMFKDYIVNLPAGDFDNEEGLERYMPTGKQRIEAIQKKGRELLEQEKEARDEIQSGEDVDRNQRKLDKIADLKRKTIFEIAEIRNHMQVGRDKKELLDKPIPTGERIRYNIEQAADAELNDAQKQFLEERFKDALEGHGGQMIENIKDYMIKNGKESLGNGCETVILKNTISGGLFELSLKATDIYDSISETRSEIEELQADIKKIQDVYEQKIEELKDVAKVGEQMNQLNLNDPEVLEELLTSGLVDPELIEKNDIEGVRTALKEIYDGQKAEMENEIKESQNKRDKLIEVKRQELDEKQKELNDLLPLGKKVVAEYLLLGGIATDPDTKKMNLEGLYKEMPWKTVDRIRKEGPEANPEFGRFAEVITLDNLSDFMEIAANTKKMNGPTKMAHKLIDIRYERDVKLDSKVLKPKKPIEVIQSDKVVKADLRGPGMN